MSQTRETTLLSSPLLSYIYLLVKSYVTFILHGIAFIFGRDEEEDQYACHVQERQLSLPQLSPSEIYLLVNLFTKLHIIFIL